MSAPIIGLFGRIALGPTGSQYVFTCDPEDYRPWQWKKRMTVIEGVGGSVTIQDFGIYAKDLEVEINGPQDQLMERSLVALIHALFRVKGAVYRLTDWLGNDFTVFMTDFTPVADARLPGYSYTMKLHVLGIVSLFGQPYTGT